MLLELIEYIEPRDECRAPRAGQDVGSAHLSFIVDDIAGEHERLSRSGRELRHASGADRGGRQRGGWVCYLADPDGITLELFQPAGRAD